MMPVISKQALKTAGMRVTNERSIILGIMRQGHFDANEIYRRARKKDPHLSLSTVYRTMQAFKRIGLVDELHLSDTHHHYEVKPSTEHHHLVCLGCGRVIEFHYPLSRHIKRSVPEAKDFTISETEFSIKGYCSQCRQEKR